MTTSTTLATPKVALGAVLIVAIIGALIWTASQISSLRRGQAEQAARLQQVSATPVAAAAVRPEPAPAPPPPAGGPPPNWAEQLTEIRNETRSELVKLQEQIRSKDNTEAQLATLREENRAEIARLREEMALSDQQASKQARERQEDLLKGLREQVRSLDRRTAVLASSVRGVRAARASAAAARRKRLALRPVTPASRGNVTVVYPSSRR